MQTEYNFQNDYMYMYIVVIVLVTRDPQAHPQGEQPWMDPQAIKQVEGRNG